MLLTICKSQAFAWTGRLSVSKRTGTSNWNEVVGADPGAEAKVIRPVWVSMAAVIHPR